MAHEIAHVAARHGTRQATRGTLLNYASLPLVFMGGWGGYAIQQAAIVAIPIGFLTFSRGFEKEADMLGLEYMYKAGYDPTAFVDFFERIESLETTKPDTISKMFATHPITEDRIQIAQKNINEILKVRPEYVVNTSEFDDVRARLAQVENHGRVEVRDTKTPRLRRGSGNINGPIDQQDADTKPPQDQGDRPTPRRRD